MGTSTAKIWKARATAPSHGPAECPTHKRKPAILRREGTVFSHRLPRKKVWSIVMSEGESP
jgi:hypothetical protein